MVVRGRHKILVAELMQEVLKIIGNWVRRVDLTENPSKTTLDPLLGERTQRTSEPSLKRVSISRVEKIGNFLRI